MTDAENLSIFIANKAKEKRLREILKKAGIDPDV